MKFKLKDVLPNPNRNLKAFPLSEAKVQELVRSIQDTTFWENVVGRKTKDGKLEIAYGHHRLEAAVRVHGRDADFDFIVKDLSNAMMLKIMHNENKEIYGNDLRSTINDVRAVVMALANGEITSGIEGVGKFDITIAPKTNVQHICNAPSFCSGKVSSADSAEHPYTTIAIAQFLGCVRDGGKTADDAIQAAFRWLEAEERNISTPSLETLRKRPAIPAQKVLEATREAEYRYELTVAREKERAAETKRNAETIQEQLKRAEKEKKEAEAEHQRLIKARMEATRKEDEEKAARIKKEQAEAKQRAVEAEKQLKQRQKEWKANEKERAASLDAQRKAKEDAARRAEAQWNASVTTLIESLNTALSNSDSLFDTAKVIGRDKRLTDGQRKSLLKAADAIHDRVDDIKRLINPDQNKKK